MKNTGIYKIEDFKLDQENLMVYETIFHNGNGYLGVRGNLEEGYQEGMDSIRGMYINGFYDFSKMSQAEKLYGMVEEKQTIVNIADTQGIRIKLEDESFSMFTGTVLKSERLLNMKEGYTQRKVQWRSPKGKEIELTITRMTSFERTELFLIDYQVQALNFTGDIYWESDHLGDVKNYFNPNDPRVAGEERQYLERGMAWVNEDGTFLETKTSASHLTLCTGVSHKFSRYSQGQEQELHSHKFELMEQGHHFLGTAKTSIREGETIRLKKYTVVTDSIRFTDCCNQAEKLLHEDIRIPILDLYGEQKKYLDDYWTKAYLDIEGDEELELAVQYNIYQLIQSVSRDGYGNIAAKGLSGEGYEGHYFWDTEMYIQPFFTLTNPQISKSLIKYRYNTLDGAREHARILGHQKGALYPWRTIMGKECSGYFPSGSAQYHINGDIAHSVSSYYLGTGDLDFIATVGAEIVFETARLWMDAGNDSNGTFMIHEVTGPDEYTCLVSNNYYTNVAAKHNLHWAVKFYHLLEEAGKLESVAKKIGLTLEEVKAFQKAEETMYLPYDESLGINPQDDSFLSKEVWNLSETPKENFPLLLHYHPLYLYRHQVCKQADTVLAHFVFEDEQSLETIHNSFLYYEKITTHDSSLSTCIFSIVASKLDMKEKAYYYFGDSAKLDLFNTHKNTKDGIHTANMGGNYMAIVYGFGGVRLKETGLSAKPYLPENWTSYEFKIWYRGCRILFKVTKDTCTVTLVEGTSCTFTLYDEAIDLKEQEKIVIQRKEV